MFNRSNVIITNFRSLVFISLQATVALRGVQIISEYPVRMQKKLAQFGEIER